MGRTNVGGGAGGNSRQVKVSMVDELVCMSLIGGLNDEETKQEM